MRPLTGRCADRRTRASPVPFSRTGNCFPFERPNDFTEKKTKQKKIFQLFWCDRIVKVQLCRIPSKFGASWCGIREIYLADGISSPYAQQNTDELNLLSAKASCYAAGRPRCFENRQGNRIIQTSVPNISFQPRIIHELFRRIRICCRSCSLFFCWFVAIRQYQRIICRCGSIINAGNSKFFTSHNVFGGRPVVSHNKNDRLFYFLFYSEPIRMI